MIDHLDQLLKVVAEISAWSYNVGKQKGLHRANY
jgi:hypothetical protein